MLCTDMGGMQYSLVTGGLSTPKLIRPKAGGDKRKVGKSGITFHVLHHKLGKYFIQTKDVAAYLTGSCVVVTAADV